MSIGFIVRKPLWHDFLAKSAGLRATVEPSTTNKKAPKSRTKAELLRMDKAITQTRAKVLIRDYLRETGRKGVTSLMRDINRHARREVFAQRTLEKWLIGDERALQDENWALVLSFIQSERFRSFVPYANEGPSERRLIQVADGLTALLAHARHPDGPVSLPSTIAAQADEAMALLDGNWENVPNERDRDVPRTICKIAPVAGKRYARFAYIALFRSKQISATGLVIYLNAEQRNDADYCYSFVLQLWRRRDPESETRMPGGLIHFTLKKSQPEFAVSTLINRYFYKEPDPLGAQGDVLHALEPDLETARYKRSGSLSEVVKFRWAAEATPRDAVFLKRVLKPIEEEEQIIDQLLEDVLPHGLAAP